MTNTTSSDIQEEYNRIKGDIEKEVIDLANKCVSIVKRFNFDDGEASIRDLINRYISDLYTDPVKTLLNNTDAVSQTIMERMFGVIKDIDDEDLPVLDSGLEAIISNLNDDSLIDHNKLYPLSCKLPIKYRAYYALFIVIEHFSSCIKKKLNTIPYIDFNEYLTSLRLDTSYVNNDNIFKPSHLRHRYPAEGKISDLTDPIKYPKFKLIFRDDHDNITLAKFYYIIATGHLERTLDLNLILFEFEDIFKELVVAMMGTDDIVVDKSLLDFSDILNLETTMDGSNRVIRNISAKPRPDYVNSMLFNFIKIVNDPDIIPLLSQLSLKLPSNLLVRYYDIPQVRLVIYRIFSKATQSLHGLGAINISDKYFKSLRYFDSNNAYQLAIVDLMLSSIDSEKFNDILNGSAIRSKDFGLVDNITIGHF